MNLILIGTGKYIEDNQVKPTDYLMKGDGHFYRPGGIETKNAHLYDMRIYGHRPPLTLAEEMEVYAKKGKEGTPEWTSIKEIMENTEEYYVSYPVEHTDCMYAEPCLYQERVNATPAEFLASVKTYADDYKEKHIHPDTTTVIWDIETEFPSMFSGYSDNRIWLKVHEVNDLEKEEDFIFFTDAEYTINGIEVRTTK